VGYDATRDGSGKEASSVYSYDGFPGQSLVCGAEMMSLLFLFDIPGIGTNLVYNIAGD